MTDLNPAIDLKSDSGVSPKQKLQWKIQVLLHINSMLIKKSQETRTMYESRQVPTLASLSKEQMEQILIQYTKRIHCNLHTISQINQGNLAAKPPIMDPPPNPFLSNTASAQERQQDMLVKMYLLMNRMFQLW
ncbi:Snf11p [Kluyveromyces lactis]|uniref:KLLA0E10165p n=1 Tax=Kluyveromyces lactis (strain ATCC 8585 / CBS 2359 / DSM 70799 / NBRC 1267 / NRRL Y-1140 / WM37) TaxID=284590 RepID=Q6CNT1_KLULA|nr:uncharacterized protein KLLA0_E10165g [Kluyveromyces lactis]CAG99495.1 KLLA0E10165p [Kluyveromyces lactis]|eukprot:XP_454408.1 uncharacterized protein KLLA0_E10165g [Kluyveromyces lactis]